MKRNNVITIMQKEFARFFGDRRMLLMILLPGLMIYVLYSFMGNAMGSLFMPDTDYAASVYVVNPPDWLIDGETGFDLRVIGISDVAVYKVKLSEQTADLCVVFPENFTLDVMTYDVTSGDSAPNIEVYYNAINANSGAAYSQMINLLNNYETSLSNKFDVNRGIDDTNQASEEDTAAKLVSSLLPMMLMIFLFSGCTAVAPESISGEKERGTIATLLVTPLSRAELAVGKILSLAVLSLLTGLVSAVATILAIPKIMPEGADTISVNIYESFDFLMLALVILSTILLLVTAVAIISALSKTVKEASTAIVPIMVVVSLVGVLGMLSSDKEMSFVYYLIPLFNSVKGMGSILSTEYTGLNIAAVCLSNLIYSCAGGFVLTGMFNNEKIMFSN